MAKKLTALLLALTMLLTLVPSVLASAESTEEWLDLVVDLEFSDTANFLDNPNDVVTPYIENKFHIRVSDIIQGGLTTIGFKERLATYIAADNLPDVVICGNEMAAYAVSTGYYGDGYADLIENNMPNLNKYFDQSFWPRYMNNGVKTQIPQVTVDSSKEPYVSDPYVNPNGVWSLWVREDLLAKAGYTFTPVKEIAANTTEKGIMPTTEDFAITPAIETPEDFRAMLEKIDALDIKVGDSDLIPFSSIDWSQFHVGTMFDFGHWRVTDDGNVGGFLGTDGAKEYYKYLNSLYNAGLIDPDFIVQTSDQLQSKIAAGRVASGMYIGDTTSAQSALFQTVGEDAAIRFIEWPKADETGLGAYDIYEAGFWRVIIRSDFEQKERLIEYFDWFFSDEAMDIMTWGPEEAGLYTTDENGVRHFVDETTQNDVLNEVYNSKGADYYGLYGANYSSYYKYLNKAAACAPYVLNYNPYSAARTVAPNLPMLTVNRLITSLGGYDMSGRYAYGDGSDTVASVSSWYWSKFTGELVAPILTAASDEEFETAWGDMYEEFLEDTDYEEAVELMTQWFAENR